MIMISAKSYRRSLDAAFKLQKKYTYQGLPICIENKKGSVRKGVEPNGKPWSIKMPFDYGYVADTKGVDGDEVDVFIGPNKKATHVFVVHQKQNKPGNAIYDEDKCFLGWDSADEAKKAYHSAYNNVDLFHSMTMMTFAEFKEKLETFEGKKLHASLQINSGGPGSGRHKEFGDLLEKHGFKKTEDIAKFHLKTFTHPTKGHVELVENAWEHRQGNKLVKSGHSPESLKKHLEKTNSDKKTVVKQDKKTALSHKPGMDRGYHWGNKKYTKSSAFFKTAKESELPTHIDFMEDEDDFPKPTAASVDLSKIKTNPDLQDDLDTQRVEEYVKGKPDAGRPALSKDKPILVKYKDSYTILDGHHRLAADKLKGLSKADVNVIDLTNFKKNVSAGGPGSGRHYEGGPKKRLPTEEDILKKEERLGKQRLKQAAQRQALNKQGLSQRGKPIVSEKAKRALANVSVAGKNVQDIAESAEHKINGALKGSIKSKNNSPFDIVHTDSKGKRHGIEVKALVTQKNDKITQKGDAIARKAAYAKANKIKGQHTVAVDYRGGGKPIVYHREGVGSFRLAYMTKVKGGFNGLHSIFN